MSEVTSPKKRIRNIRDLTASLFHQYERYLNGEIDSDEAKTLSHMARAAIMGLKIQLDEAARMGSKDVIPGLGSNVKQMGPITIHAEAQEQESEPAQVGPAKADLRELILRALGAAQSPLREEAVCQWLIDQGELPGDYVESLRHQVGGPYAFIRGHLAYLSRHANVLMERDNEGRAVFSMVPPNQHRPQDT